MRLDTADYSGRHFTLPPLRVKTTRLQVVSYICLRVFALDVFFVAKYFTQRRQDARKPQRKI